VQLNNRTKLGAGLLVVALGALGYDRFSGGPAPAAASTPEAAPAPPLKPEPGPTTTPVAPIPPGALAQRLDELQVLPAAPGTCADAFQAPAAWFPAPEQPKAEKKPEAPKHEVKSINCNKNQAGELIGATAVIDGHVLSLGKSFETKDAKGDKVIITLKSATIKDDRSGVAVIEVNGELTELKLDPPSVQGHQ